MIKTAEEQVQAAVTFCYEMITTDVDGDEDMRYTTYGVRALGEGRGIVAEYPDVSTNKEFVSGIVEKLNHSQADVLHLQDILEDSLG